MYVNFISIKRKRKKSFLRPNQIDILISEKSLGQCPKKSVHIWKKPHNSRHETIMWNFAHQKRLNKKIALGGRDFWVIIMCHHISFKYLALISITIGIINQECIHNSIPFLLRALELKEVSFVLKEPSQLQVSFLSYILEGLPAPEFRGTLLLSVQCDFSDPLH